MARGMAAQGHLTLRGQMAEAQVGRFDDVRDNDS